MTRAAATLAAALLALTAAASYYDDPRPGLYVQTGVRDGIYYGRVTAVDLKTLEIIPYDPRPLAPIPDPERLMADLQRARDIAIARGYLKPEPEPKPLYKDIPVILLICVPSLLLFILGSLCTRDDHLSPPDI